MQLAEFSNKRIKEELDSNYYITDSNVLIDYIVSKKEFKTDTIKVGVFLEDNFDNMNACPFIRIHTPFSNLSEKGDYHFFIYGQEIMPLYLASRYIEFGTFFQRLDSAFLLILNIAICSFLGIYSNLCLGIIKDISSISDSKPISYPFVLLLYSCTILIDAKFELEFMQNQFFKAFFFVILTLGLVILILANLKKSLKGEIKNE